MAANNIFDGLAKALEEGANAGLAALGEEIAKGMKKELRKNESDVSHRLYDSITWATTVAVDRSSVGPAAEAGDVIDKPTERYTLLVGTQAPHAIYVEKGTGPHVTSDQADEYEDRIREWAAKKGITDPDEVEGIITNIRRKGTLKHPFVQPVRDEWDSSGRATRIMSDIVNKTLSKVVKDWKPVIVPVEIKV